MKFCKTLSLIEVAHFEAHQNATYPVVVLVIIYMFIFLPLFLHSVGKYWKRGEFKRKNIAFCILFGQFHLSFGFWIVNALLIDYISPSNVNLHQVTLTVIALLIILNYCIAFFVSICSYDPFLSSNMLSCHSPIFQTLTICFKGVAAPIIFLWEDLKTANWAFIVIALLIFIGKLSHLVSTFPYYHHIAMKIALLFSAVNLLFAFLSFIALTDLSSHIQASKVLVYIELLLVPLVCALPLSCLNIMMDSYLSGSNKDINTLRSAFKKLFALKHAIDQAGSKSIKEENRILIEAKFHHHHHQDNILIFRARRTQLMKTYLKQFIEEMILKFEQKSEFLRMLFLHLSLEDDSAALGSLMIHLMELSKAEGGETQLITLKMSQRLQTKTTNFFEENKEKILNLNQFLVHENISNKMDSAIQKHLKFYINFWTAYLKANLQIHDFYLKSKELEKNADYIESLWKSRIESDKILARSFYQLYSSYFMLLRASPFQAQLINKKYSQFLQEKVIHNLINSHEFSIESLTDPNVFAIHATIAKESTGKVTGVSANFGRATGWSNIDAVGRSVNLILPRFIAKGHHRILQNHLRLITSGENSKKMYKTIPTYFQHHDGYMVPCDIYISLHPIVQATPIYIVFVRINTSLNVEKMLLSRDGSIEGFTESIGNFLNLPNKNNEKMNFEKICKNSGEIQDILERVESTDQEISLDVYFTSPFNKNAIACAVRVNIYPYDGEIYYLLSISQRKSQEFSFPQQHLEGTLRTLSSQAIDEEFAAKGKTAPSLVGKSGFFTTQLRLSRETQADSPRKNASNRMIENSRRKDSEFVAFEDIPTNRNLLENKKKEQQRGIFFKRPKDEEEIQIDKKFKVSSSIGSVTKHSMTKFERVLMNVPKNPQLNWTYLTFLALMLFSELALIVFEVKNSSTLTQVHGSEEVISNTIFRLTRYTDTYAYARILWQATVGLTNPYKYLEYGYTASTIDFNLPIYKQILQDVRDTNEVIQDFVSKLDPTLVNEIYGDLVPVYDKQSDGTIVNIRNANLFDLSIELVSHGIKFINSGLPYDDTNPYIDFLLNNTMNEPLLANQREVPIMLNNNVIQFGHLTDYIHSMVGVTCACAVLIFALFVWIVRKFQLERQQFIVVFTHINQKRITEQLSQLENFQNILTKAEEKTFKSQYREQTTRPTVDAKGINKIFYFLYAALACFLTIICTPFPFMLSDFKHGSNTILNKMNLMAESNLNFYNLVYYWNVVYAYAQYGVWEYEYVKNEPITIGVVEAYEKVVNVQDYIINTLLDSENGLSENQELSQIAIGNLCEIYPEADALFDSFCPTLGGGVATKGILGLYTYHLIGLQAIQQCYNFSSKSFDDSKRCLGLQYMVDFEVIYPCTYWAFHRVDAIIKEEMAQDYDHLDALVEVIMWIYLAGFVFVGSVVGWKILAIMNKEINDWRKMLRQLPFIVGKENKFLKVFLQRHRSHI